MRRSVGSLGCVGRCFGRYERERAREGRERRKTREEQQRGRRRETKKEEDNGDERREEWKGDSEHDSVEYVDADLDYLHHTTVIHF